MGLGELVPELHDVGKLVDEEAIACAIPGWPDQWLDTGWDPTRGENELLLDRLRNITYRAATSRREWAGSELRSPE